MIFRNLNCLRQTTLNISINVPKMTDQHYWRKFLAFLKLPSRKSTLNSRKSEKTNTEKSINFSFRIYCSNVQEKSLLVMENLFYDYNIDNKFDLKGSLRNRLVDPNNQTGEETVLLDENLLQSKLENVQSSLTKIPFGIWELFSLGSNFMCCIFLVSWSNPLYILTHSKSILCEAINRDAQFLEKNGVMDYSLLVGLSGSGKLLVLGIIGKFAQQFDRHFSLFFLQLLNGN